MPIANRAFTHRLLSTVLYGNYTGTRKFRTTKRDRPCRLFIIEVVANGYSSLHNWLPTGIGIKKFVNAVNTKIADNKIVTKAEPAIRYAEILLIYAEALNELEDGKMYNILSWDGSATYSIHREKSRNAKRYPSYPQPGGSSRL